MRSCILSTPALLAVAVASLIGCGGEPERPLLSPHALIGASPDALRERLGDPNMHIAEKPDRIGFLRWNNIDGIRVLVVYAESRSTYVTYRFPEHGGFDEDQAFARLGISRPSVPETPMGGANARVWKPGGDFERISINPETRLLSVGATPDWSKRGLRGEDPMEALEMLEREVPEPESP